ncbi:hypothetical protein MKZ38_007656 [Zalerion maritima]|uniref:Cytochrome b-c1 complex subunit 2, mitochondrial n=1 Tax=Zalerion maritima TaxID=339359 RepID=A0AAD5WXJ9_9PEZI|nr:hypothetical protein MKZ38_007656 [Zalerion maritima]
MFSKSALSRGTRFSLRRPTLQASQRRAYAAATSSGLYETTDVSGLKTVSRDTHGPTTKLAVVAKAGTRYDACPGLTVGLQEYAFKSTFNRSALRIQRESELLGGQVKAYHTREALVLEASFLRSDLPYFTELLAEVISQTRFTTHEFHEEIEPVLALKQAEWSHDAPALTQDLVHSVAFHSGLGNALFPSTQVQLGKYLDEHNVESYAKMSYAKDNVAVVADGVNSEIFNKWVDKFFKEVPAVPSQEHKELRKSHASKYFGGEHRTDVPHGNSVAVGFQADPTKPEFDVLASLLGGQSSISWSPGFTLLSKVAVKHDIKASASNLKYSDAGLLVMQFTGGAGSLKGGVVAGVKALETIASGVSKEDLTKAVAKAKFDYLESSQNRDAGIVAAGLGSLSSQMPNVSAAVKGLEGVTADQVKAAAKSLLDSKASVATVGDLYVLPYAESMGLKSWSSGLRFFWFYRARLNPIPPNTSKQPPTSPNQRHNDFRVEGRWPQLMLTMPTVVVPSYNRYTMVAARVLRRALKEDKRIAAERRGESELRFAKWTNGKPSELQQVNVASMAEKTS